MEPPSQKLAENLKKLSLCTEADVRKCRRQVRSLARDLPAFDSVWIDALKQIKVITSFQAKMLESSEINKLKLASYLIEEELGAGNSSTTYLCRCRTKNEKLVLKKINIHTEDLQPAFDRLNSEIKRLKTFQHPSLVIPAKVEIDSNCLITLSRNIPGLNLMDLIIRRGRIESNIVEQIAIQLLDALSSLESAGGIHGDIRLRNIRVTPSGNLVMVDACITPMVFPSLLVNGRIDPEEYDGISPERIGTSQMPTASSDMFALGTLLWHLLAGRSPFPVGDPIAKLALYQTKRIEDIRVWVPDCSSQLAELINHLTEPDPANRPDSFQSIRKNWKGTYRRSCKKLARFRESFNQTVSNQSQNSSFGRKRKNGILVPILLVLFLSSSIVLLDQWGFKGNLLNISSTINSFNRNNSKTLGDNNKTKSETALAVQEKTKNHSQKESGKKNENRIPKPKHGQKNGFSKNIGYQQIPSADNQGILELDSGLYQARNISEVGDLVIRGVGPRPTIIMVPSEGISLGARVLRLQNVVFQSSENSDTARVVSSSTLQSQLRMTCQNLEIHHCKFDFYRVKPLAQTASCTISWKPLDSADSRGMRILLKDSSFLGGGTVLYLDQTPGAIETENCLALNTNAFASFPLNKNRSKIRASFHNLTVRNSGARNSESVVQFRLENEKNRPLEKTIGSKSIVIDMQNSVFSSSKENAAMIQLQSKVNPQSILSRVEIVGEGNLIPKNVSVAVWRQSAVAQNSKSDKYVVLDDQNMEIEGLSIASFKFAGKPTSRVKDSVIKEFNAPRLSDKLPGIQVPILISKRKLHNVE